MQLRSVFLACVLLVLSPESGAQRLSTLAPAPDWLQLEAFQETITREEFTDLLSQVYAPNDAAKGLIDITPGAAVILKQLGAPDTFTLRFAKDPASAKPIPRHWRPAASLGAAPSGKPLAGVKIAIDPGHLGGEWARMEERWFQLPAGQPVVEGDLTLRVAQLLAPRLSALGAEVTLVRNAPAPTTRERPETLREAARGELALRGVSTPRDDYNGPNDPTRGDTVRFLSELLFFRSSEIRSRARVVNEQLRPDLVLCLHFNAEAWGDPVMPALVPHNHLHVLVNGYFAAVELRNDDVRFDMLLKLLSRSFHEELAASDMVVSTLAREAKLPPYVYT
nr:N-acetylmuramoyl-L-alanine amidase [Verrucomicrobiota bacterium]